MSIKRRFDHNISQFGDLNRLHRPMILIPRDTVIMIAAPELAVYTSQVREFFPG